MVLNFEEELQFKDFMRKLHASKEVREADIINSKISSEILIAVLRGEDPTSKFNLQSWVRHEIYYLAVLKLEAFGYAYRNADDKLELTATGKEFAEKLV